MAAPAEVVLYSVQKLAQMLNGDPSTVRAWLKKGERGRAGGVVKLQAHRFPSEPRIPGRRCWPTKEGRTLVIGFSLRTNGFRFEEAYKPAGSLATTGLTSLHVLREAYAFLFGNSSQKVNDSLAKYADAVKVLPSKGFELHASSCKSLQVIERFGYALAAEAVEAPEEHYIEAALVASRKSC